MTTLVDRVLAVIGLFAATVRRLTGGSSRRVTWIALALFALTAVPILLVATSHRPTDLSFEDMRTERIPPNTSWGRLEGELRRTSSAFGGLYELHDTNEPDLYVIVITDADLPDGHTMVTGEVSPRRTATGNAGTITADIPAVPRADEPIWLYLAPAVARSPPADREASRLPGPPERSAVRVLPRPGGRRRGRAGRAGAAASGRTSSDAARLGRRRSPSARPATSLGWTT